MIATFDRDTGEQIPDLQGAYTRTLHRQISAHADDKTEWYGFGPLDALVVTCNSDCKSSVEGHCTRDDFVLMLWTECDGKTGHRPWVICDDYWPKEKNDEEDSRT